MCIPLCTNCATLVADLFLLYFDKPWQYLFLRINKLKLLKLSIQRFYNQYYSADSWWMIKQMSRDMTKPTKRVCAQRILRSVRASAQFDQRFRCMLNGYLRTLAFFMQTAKTGRMSRLIWVFAGRTVTLLVYLCRGSNKYSGCSCILWSSETLS